MAKASRAIIKKTFPQLYASSSSVLSSTACFSTAHEFAEGSNNIDNAVKEGLQEAKHQGLSMPEDVARDGAVKAAEKADAIGETAEETLEKIKEKAAYNENGPKRNYNDESYYTSSSDDDEDDE